MRLKLILLGIISCSIVISCITHKRFMFEPATSLSLDFTKDSVFEYLYYYNGSDTSFLKYSKGKYKLLEKGVYLLKSDSFDNTSCPIDFKTSYLDEIYEGLRIKLNTNITDDLAPELITTLYLDSFKLKTNKPILDTVIKKRVFNKISVSTEVVKNTGIPAFDYSILKSKFILLDNNKFNKIEITFPIYDYLFNYTILNNQIITKKSKYYIISAKSGSLKILRKNNIYRWWE